MGFKKRAATTGKVAVPQAVREEIELVFFHEIAHKSDQTPTKFVPDSSRTQAQIGSDSVPIAGSNDKSMITATFTTAVNGVFYPCI